MAVAMPLSELAQRVNVMLRKTDNMRLSAGRLLWDAKRRVAAGEAGPGMTWRAWVAANLERSYRDANRLVALVRADDPEAAAEQERARTRAAVRLHRERRGIYVSPTGRGGGGAEAEAGPGVVAAVADPAPSAAPRGREEDQTEALWPAFARLDRASQVAFARRVLWHLGLEPGRIDAVLDGPAERQAEPGAPAVERPEAGPTAAPPGGRPHVYAGAKRRPRGEVEGAGYSPAGAYTYKGVPGTLLRNAEGAVKYWSPDWAAAPAPAAAA